MIELWTFDAAGEDEHWQRSIAEGESRVDVGDLAFSPGRGYGSPSAYNVDGKLAIARYGSRELSLVEGDEIVSVGGVPVGTLSSASLDALVDNAAPDVPIVAKKKGETATVTIHRPVPKAGERK